MNFTINFSDIAVIAAWYYNKSKPHPSDIKENWSLSIKLNRTWTFKCNHPATKPLIPWKVFNICMYTRRCVSTIHRLEWQQFYARFSYINLFATASLSAHSVSHYLHYCLWSKFVRHKSCNVQCNRLYRMLKNCLRINKSWKLTQDLNLTWKFKIPTCIKFNDSLYTL